MSSTAVPSISAFRSCCRRYRMTFACTRCCRASLVNVPRELYVVSRKHRHCFATNLGNFHTLTVYCKDYLISRVRIMVNQSMVNNVVNLLGTFWKRCRQPARLWREPLARKTALWSGEYKLAASAKCRDGRGKKANHLWLVKRGKFKKLICI